MPSNAIANYNKELDNKYKELESLLNTDTKTERDYIVKNPSHRDQYDIAFGRLNPESRAKADRFNSLVGEIQTINNNMVNLESAKHFFKNLYSQQRAETNTGFDKLQQSNALSNDIALSSALSTAGGMGASGIQSAGLKAQANNLLAATQQKAEAERQDALSKITQAEAQVPLQLANIGQINYQLSKPDPVPSYGGGGGSGRRRLPPSGGGKEGPSDNEKLLIDNGFKKTADGGWERDGQTYHDWQALGLINEGINTTKLKEKDKTVLIASDDATRISEITEDQLNQIAKELGGKKVLKNIDGVYHSIKTEDYNKYGEPETGFWGNTFKVNPWNRKEQSYHSNIIRRVRKTEDLKKQHELMKANFIVN